MTNGDKIRKMSDEELARFLFRISDACRTCLTKKLCKELSDAGATPCRKIYERWLKQEAKDE